ncbi:maleylacetoacetate isomerase [Oceanibacterium hippocampi]|uniref:Maleylpyruvate isomerase n=1 Tax=Oceanibacterium hippocampi TaxID=745714 RepID=A0A1Y5RPY5_9PROT|nr:maleylacetoacetate isomerase [Oceanibacterium hippocampi]SLN22612.1 Maleylpyruvate isomerase [Oceanibacterium hippocampi]
MRLHSYFRSSTSYRARIALNLKGLDYETVTHHLRKGEQRAADYLALNPQGLVPALEVDGMVIPQSLAIIDYLEERKPDPALLPADLPGRARVRGIAYALACDVHPLNNLRVLSYLADPLGHDQPTVATWFRHWCVVELNALETRLAREPETGSFCHGETPTLADVCLVPQIRNGQRFDVDMAPYPTLQRIYDRCMTFDAFVRAAPENQPDAE